MGEDPVEFGAEKRPGGWTGSIQTRLAVVFSITFAVVLTLFELVDFLGIPFTPFKGRLWHHQDEAKRSLNLIADLKKERLSRWIRERRDDGDVIANSPLLRAELEALQQAAREFTTPGVAEADLWALLRKHPAYENLLNHLTHVKDIYGVYDRILLADATTGRVLVSAAEEDSGTNVAGEDFFTGALESGLEYIGDVRIAGPGRNPVLDIAHALHTEDGKVFGVLLTEINTEDMIRPMLHTGGGLGAGGEALLINKEVRILTSLKHPLRDSTKPKPLQYRITAEPAVLAAQGEEGIIESDDYRGEPVLAAYRYIEITPELGWGMVVKRDQAELYAPIRADAMDSFWVGLASVAAVVVLTVAVARGVSSPIRALGRTAQEVSDGDLAARAPVTTSDEVGALATTFNAMVERIQHWQKDLQAEVRSRTAELHDANTELARHRDHLEKSVRERTRELEEVHEALVRQERLATLGQLTATVSHELRNPLGTIRTSFFSVAQRLGGKQPEIQAALDRVDRSVIRCDAIIRDLLDFSRVGKLQPKATEVDDWLAAVLKEYEFPEGITLHRQLAAGVTLPLDRERLRRCMINLLSNACQAMAPDGGDLTVTSGVEDARVVIRVIDGGCGIAPQEFEKIFEPLFSTKSFGVGLGLPIVRQIVQQHGGTIEMENRPGQGAVATVYLPIRQTEETPDE